MADRGAIGAGIALRDLAMRALLIKGFATAEGFAPVVLSTEEVAASELAAMVDEGLAEPMGPMFKLSTRASSGPRRCSLRIPKPGASMPPERLWTSSFPWISG